MIETMRSVVTPEEYRREQQPPRGIERWARACERRPRLSDTVRIARGIRGMDDAFYLDSRGPFQTIDVPSVTLAATDKALYTTSFFPVLGGNYFKYPGKAVEIWMFGRITTGATPGNLTWDVYWGSGADANGTILASSAAVALIASQTSLSWYSWVRVRCRTTGSAGTLFCTGGAHFNVAVMASTNQPQLIPASLAAVSGAVDLTAASIISVQTKRSGSTAETMQVHEMSVVALN